MVGQLASGAPAFSGLPALGPYRLGRF